MKPTLRVEAGPSRGGLGDRSPRRAHELIVLHCHGGPPDGRVAKTLYDLLGASPSDDAEGLKSAFRRAVKANHPDFHRDDSGATMRLSGIVRAYAILRDARERASYDQALEFEREASRPQRKRIFRSSMHHIFAEARAVAILAVLLGGGYLVVANVLSQLPENGRPPQAPGSTGIAVVTPPVGDEARTSAITRTAPKHLEDEQITRPMNASVEPVPHPIASLPEAPMIEEPVAAGEVASKAAITDHLKSNQEVEEADREEDSKPAANAAPPIRVERSVMKEPIAASQSPPVDIAPSDPPDLTPDLRQAPGSRSPAAREHEITAHERRRAGAIRASASRAPASHVPSSHEPLRQASLENKGVQPCAESQSCSSKSPILLGVGF